MNLCDVAVPMYVDQRMSTPDIAKALGASISTVRRALMKSGVSLRSAPEATTMTRGVVADKLRGRKHITPAMRELINKGRRASPSVQDAEGISRDSRGYMRFSARLRPHYGRLVHVVLMEETIGRRLMPGEVVHHIDQDKKNNDLSNLQLMTNSAHVALHRALRKEKQ